MIHYLNYSVFISSIYISSFKNLVYKNIGKQCNMTKNVIFGQFFLKISSNNLNFQNSIRKYPNMFKSIKINHLYLGRS